MNNMNTHSTTRLKLRDVFLISKCRTIYNMCTQKPPHDYSQQLYDKYQEVFQEYIGSMVRVFRNSLFIFPFMQFGLFWARYYCGRLDVGTWNCNLAKIIFYLGLP